MTRREKTSVALWSFVALVWTFTAVVNFYQGANWLGAFDVVVIALSGLNVYMCIKNAKLREKIQETRAEIAMFDGMTKWFDENPTKSAEDRP